MRAYTVLLASGLLIGWTLAVATCHASELPVSSVCNIISEIAYDEAVAAGDPLPDGAYERAQGECEWDADFGAGVPLNELVAVDGEVWLPVCQFEGGCVQ